MTMFDDHQQGGLPTGGEEAPATLAGMRAPALALLGQLETGVDAVGLAFDPVRGELFLYGGSDAEVNRFAADGTPLGSFARPGEAADDFDLHHVVPAFTLAGTAIPAGSLLAINGESGRAEIYALDPASGAVLATLSTAFGNNYVVGGAFHAARGTIFLVQGRLAGSTNGNLVAEIDPATGAILNSFRINGTGFTVNYGDIEVDPVSGHLFLVSSDETTLLRVSPAGTLIDQVELPAGVSGTISGLAMNPDAPGEAFIATTAGSVYRISGLDDFPPFIDLASLAPGDGFVIQGDSTLDHAGEQVGGGGDVNGDGFADLIVGAPDGSDGGDRAGEAYVIFGRAGAIGSPDSFGRSLVDLTSLAPADGFVIRGDEADDRAGEGVAFAGDVNGDGYADLLVGAWRGDDGGAEAGEAYLVFGKAGGFGTLDEAGRTVVDLTSLAAADGFVIRGDTAGGFAGRRLSTGGDVNGDGYEDLVIGAAGDGSGGTGTGRAFVIFGGAGGLGVPDAAGRAVIDLATLAPARGFAILGDPGVGATGFSVSDAGDLDGDGFGDLVIGAPGTGEEKFGAAYVIWGKAGGFGTPEPGSGRAAIQLAGLEARPTDGFVIRGDGHFENAGAGVSSAGDVNGDGFDDLVIGTGLTGDGGLDEPAAAYVVFGGPRAAGTIDLETLAPSAGFLVHGNMSVSDVAGVRVSSAGDFNGDGYDDIIIGASSDLQLGVGGGAAYLIFGKAGGFGSLDSNGRAAIDVGLLTADQGMIIKGPTAATRELGGSVSGTGDLNGDGFDDLVIGDPLAGHPGGSSAGAAYVIYGRATGSVGPLTGSAGNDTRVGTEGDDSFRLEQGGDDSASGGAGDDGFYFGAAFDGEDDVDGGPDTDTLAIQGAYPGLQLGDVTGVELLLVMSGSDARFGDNAGNLYDYHVTTRDSNVAAGAILSVQATGLLAGEDLHFDGSAESDGHFRIFAGRGEDDLTGGAGNDGFLFGGDGNLTAADRVDGGGGTDTIALRGNHVGAAAIVFDEASMTDVEVLAFLSGHDNPYGGVIVASGFDYDVTMAEGNLAAGASLDVIATALRADESLVFDGRAESDGSFRIILGAGDDEAWGGQGGDLLHGGLGADRLDGSGGADLYVYRGVAESTAAASDNLVLGEGDRIDLSFIDANGNDGDGNQAFDFIGDAAFGNLAGQLRAVQTGNIWIVEADVNGDGTADLVINAVSADPLVAGDFIL